MAYTPKSKRRGIKAEERAKPKKPIFRKVKDGLFIIVKGHPPAGDRLVALGYAYTEDVAKNLAWGVESAQYIYQLVYSIEPLEE